MGARNCPSPTRGYPTPLQAQGNFSGRGGRGLCVCVSVRALTCRPLQTSFLPSPVKSRALGVGGACCGLGTALISSSLPPFKNILF